MSLTKNDKKLNYILWARSCWSLNYTDYQFGNKRDALLYAKRFEETYGTQSDWFLTQVIERCNP